ncbi:MAG: response regulator [Thermodesulfobacteriota bacterium]
MSSNHTIMIVDDTPANLHLLNRMLRERGYRVRSFPSGEMALKSAWNDPPDLMLLDVNMPGMNGFEVCQRLKSEERTRGFPVIFISALTETLDKVKAFQAGGVDYITKPFQFEEVHARVEVHLKLIGAQRAIAEQNAALEKAMRELKAAQQQLIQSEKLAAIGILTAGIAHEINNPVNFIKTSALALQADIEDIQRLLSLYASCRSECPRSEMTARIEALHREIEYDTLSAEIPSLLSHIQEGVRRTEEIVQSLRLYARKDSFVKEKTDLHRLVDAALVILSPRYKKALSIRKQYGDLPKIAVYPGGMIQVITNVLGNAIDAIESKRVHEEESITLTTSVLRRNSEVYAVLSVQDTGIGIPDAVREKVFDPFFTTKDVGKGTGLGLSISLGIVQEHGGSIEIDSVEGKGTTVSILLPVGKEPV